MAKARGPLDEAKLDRVVVEACRYSEERARGYREQALNLYPWVCGRCTREFTRANLQELTVHHRDHNHDHNPADGSNWELLCVYCHDNEHARLLEQLGPAKGSAGRAPIASHQPFAALGALLGKKEDGTAG